MARVTIENDVLTVEVQGLDKVWALKSRLEIPLRNVRGATHDPGIAHEPRGIKTGGTYMPGVITAGRFIRQGEMVFWDVKNPEKTVVIELADERYARLVVEVDDPRAVVSMIEQARS
ncbi:hypothetical protein GCM10020367_46300 [Streptomyces sannanensis]|uniref:Bacterial Pleckstrin homology domain-containing protein n=1 Tax=Streptomyces sannanensis TaxID=285536 RepID=A0ABP6SGS2_9ACTN